MKIAITGGTGFLGRHVARVLVCQGHDVVLLARGHDQTDPAIRHLPRAQFTALGLDSPERLARAFSGCDAVVHCAGINREMGAETFERVHIAGTRNVVAAARQSRLRKVILISFLRARPNCGSPYHESKWAAEEITRNSGLDYTVFKCGVIYGQGDHMLDHLSRAFHTFPIFAFVGFQDKRICPNAVEDVAELVAASVVQNILSRQTVAILGPEALTLREAVRRVAKVVGRRPMMFPLPLSIHYLLAWLAERIMTVPLISVAQIRMLAEGLSEPAPPCDMLPPALAPKTPFTSQQIRRGLPPPGPFRQKDFRRCRLPHGKSHSHHRPFLEMP